MSKESDNIFDEFIESTDLSLQQILNNLLDGTHNLDLKSQIFKPKQLASLKVFGQFLGAFKFNKSQELIECFIKTYLRYMISYERQSRKEIIKAIANLFEIESKEIGKKLTTNLT